MVKRILAMCGEISGSFIEENVRGIKLTSKKKEMIEGGSDLLEEVQILLKGFCGFDLPVFAALGDEENNSFCCPISAEAWIQRLAESLRVLSRNVRAQSCCWCRIGLKIEI